LNPSVNEILTYHSQKHDNITYINNTSLVENKIAKEFLGMQMAVDALKGRK